LGAVARFTPVWHYESALLFVVIALVAYSAVKKTPAGLHLTALRQSEAAALVLGADRAKLRTGAIVASAAIGGLAGALAVQLAGIADPTTYGPLLSVKLFVAVIIGGAAFTAGPVVGAATLALVGPAAHGLGHLAGIEPARFEPLVAAALLLVALVAGGQGILPRLRSLLVRGATSAASSGAPRISVSTTIEVRPGPTVLDARSVAKSFGGLRALDGVDISVRAGSVHAVIGPNGSGKSTLLKILSGSIRPDAGSVHVDGRAVEISSVASLRELGIVRTLQRTAVFEDMSLRDHVLAGSVTARPVAGTARHLIGTPQARADEAAARVDAERVLSDVGLLDAVETPARYLSGAQQRFLMIAMALAAHPRAVLLDEPGAGMSSDHVASLIDLIGAIASRGVAVVLVEHNLRLVRSTADEVTVLSSGHVIANGGPDEISASDEVRRAYIGPTSF
jgi:ABC-type branched-subunit amino acid transport system ATPase component